MANNEQISKIIDQGVKDAHSYAIHEVKRNENDEYPRYAITVAGTPGAKGGYAVFEIASKADAQDIADRLPAPNDTLSGARLISATDVEFDGDTMTETHYFFLENKADKGGLDFTRMYDIDGLADGEPVETEARRPEFMIVATEETYGWGDGIVALLGRIKGIYGTNVGDSPYGQVWMQFLANECERRFYDLDEAEVNRVFEKIKYDAIDEFERDNSGDQGHESNRYDISKMEILEEIPMSADWLVGYMLEPEEGKRFEMERDVYGEVQANGLKGVTFKDHRSDDEIVAAGLALLKERGISLDEEGAVPSASV